MVAAGTVMVIGAAVPEGAMPIVEPEKAVAVPTMKSVNGCSKGPPTPPSIPPKTMT